MGSVRSEQVIKEGPAPEQTAFYDPGLSYEANYEQGPFGAFARPGAGRETVAQPTESFLGLPVGLPFGIPAGPLLNGRFVKAALRAGFDLPVYKTVRTRRFASHAWPNVLAVEAEGDLHPTTNRLRGHSDYSGRLSITNSFGVPSFPPEVWQPDLADAVQSAGPGQIVIGSFQGTQPEHGGGAGAYIADFALGARLIRETGVKAVEVNLSCPNEGTANLLCFDAERAQAVVEAIKAELGPVRLIAKIAYFASDEGLSRLVKAIGGMVDGFAAINTVPAEVVDAQGEQALPGEGRLRSGVCGAGIRWAGLEMSARLARMREALGFGFAIVGVGGVSDGDDYKAYRAAGADAVMSATGAMWNPQLAQQIKQAVLEPAHAG
jgi:dihydroorotate dehydrogenase (NAD+) catalytic subunit